MVAAAVRVNSLKPLTCTPFPSSSFNWPWSFVSIPRKHSRLRPLLSQISAIEGKPQIMTKVIDSHLHVWASPQEVNTTNSKTPQDFLLFLKKIYCGEVARLC